MDPDRTARHHALAEPHRARLLELLERAEDGLAVDALAAAVELHPNTVRSHLEVLVAAGLAAAADERSGRPGRPRRIFHAVATDEGEHELLAAALTGSLARAADGPALAEATGREWGRYLVERLPPGTEPTEEACVERLSALLSARGFRPRVEPGRILMRRCPFRRLAERHPEVVCGLHRGRLDGAPEQLGAPVSVERLTPFVDAEHCEARLGGRDAG